MSDFTIKLYPITLFTEDKVKLIMPDAQHYMVECRLGPTLIFTTLLDALEQVAETLSRLDMTPSVPIDEAIIILDHSRERMYARLMETVSKGMVDKIQREKLERDCAEKLNAEQLGDEK